MVMNQPMTMFLATPQRTALTRLVAPTPMIAEVITWVVEIGAWNTKAEPNMIVAPVVSAANPCGGSSSVILPPRVRKIRQPPAQVPADSITAQAILTHTGIGSP